MMSSLLGACLLAALPAQALALPATFTNTAADTQASWAPTITPSNMCKGSSYAEATGNSAALTADCQALRDAVYSNNGLWTLDAVSTDYTWILNTTGSCTVAIENPNLRSDGVTRIGNLDVLRILDHVLDGAGDTVEGKGSWWCGGDGSSSTPSWWIHNAAPATEKPATGAAKFISSAISKAKETILHGRDGASETAPWTPGSGPSTVCGNSTYTDLTNDDTSPYWWWCDAIVGWVDQNNGEWTLSAGSDDWWRLENAKTDRCELVVKNHDGSPPVGNNDALTILRYIEFDKDRAKGQKAEFQGSFACGPQQTTVQWWLRKVQT
ncbi:hypothetical protein PG999_012132 [Apiospora kogelbergensis]|uniref:Ecp2 effector protein-like domain-containing protein n=1 Tax=Apiospora kogelbergensis TaxID=1337665 RepID=A0AAW0QTY4_9PEZI